MSEMFCEHGAPMGGICKACEEGMEVKITPELEEAVLRTLCHHPYGGVVICGMITGQRFEVMPPAPTAEQRQMAHVIVEDLLRVYFRAMNSSMLEVTGEGIEDNPYV
jgi:hypothetical protein